MDRQLVEDRKLKDKSVRGIHIIVEREFVSERSLKELLEALIRLHMDESGV